ncbi:hypothetical protein [Thiohalocapsa sp.]|uniref:hypothetical protein n=1 Tax=Thiohalocapsa sp. TaxID=2497641 RepID=UPI0025D984F3|nr:hypothetical protein [Thiohalocapsa sp.]
MAMTEVVLERERVAEPLLAGLGKARLGRPPKYVHPPHQHYRALQQALRRTFETLGLAAFAWALASFDQPLVAYGTLGG